MSHCITCPFGDYSKIPHSIKDGYDYAHQEDDQKGILSLCASKGFNWTCHDNFDKPCVGYVAYCKENNIPYKGKKAVGELHDLKALYNGENCVPIK